MAVIFTSGTFIASTSKAGRTEYVRSFDDFVWSFTEDKAQAMRLNAAQANRFRKDMRHLNQIAMLETAE